MSRLRTGDTVIVIAGSDRGKTGRLISLDAKHGKALVEGVNMKWKHVRKNQDQPQGGRTQREYALDISNIAFLDAESGKGAKLGSKIEAGRKVRVLRSSGKTVAEK